MAGEESAWKAQYSQLCQGGGERAPEAARTGTRVCSGLLLWLQHGGFLSLYLSSSLERPVAFSLHEASNSHVSSSGHSQPYSLLVNGLQAHPWHVGKVPVLLPTSAARTIVVNMLSASPTKFPRKNLAPRRDKTDL